MLDGIKILIERLNASEESRWAEHLAVDVTRGDGPVEIFTDEEKAAVLEALIKYRRTQFTAMVMDKVSGTDEMTDTQWFGEATIKGEGQLIKPQKLIINRAQMDLARGLIK